MGVTSVIEKNTGCSDDFGFTIYTRVADHASWIGGILRTHPAPLSSDTTARTCRDTFINNLGGTTDVAIGPVDTMSTAVLLQSFANASMKVPDGCTQVGQSPAVVTCTLDQNSTFRFTAPGAGGAEVSICSPPFQP